MQLLGQLSNIQTNHKVDNTSGSQIRVTKMSLSRNSQMSQDPLLINAENKIDRLNLKLEERKVQYEQLLKKFDELEKDYEEMENYLDQVEREKSFMADKLKDIEIHTEGDEVTGQLEDKLVLMSSQIMRLGMLNKNKEKDYGNLNLKFKNLEEENEEMKRDLLAN